MLKQTTNQKGQDMKSQDTINLPTIPGFSNLPALAEWVTEHNLPEHAAAAYAVDAGVDAGDGDSYEDAASRVDDAELEAHLDYLTEAGAKFDSYRALWIADLYCEQEAQATA